MMHNYNITLEVVQNTSARVGTARGNNFLMNSVEPVKSPMSINGVPTVIVTEE